MGVGILCACLPVMRPVLNLVLPGHQASLSTSTYHNGRPRSIHLRMVPRTKTTCTTSICGIEDSAPFAQLDTSAIRDSHTYNNDDLDQPSDAIEVRTRIDQHTDKDPEY